MYLLDTHVIIWMLYNPSELPQNVKDIMDNETCFFSIASLWELAIKKGLKKIDIDQNMTQIANSLLMAGFEMEEITPENCDIVENLPLIHKDPFDRIIISQAMANHLTIITKDKIIPRYNIQTVWD